jgi:hypothetical protein
LRDDPDLAYGFGHQGIDLKLGGVAALRQIGLRYKLASAKPPPVSRPNFIYAF